MKKFILALVFLPSLALAVSINDYLNNTPGWEENSKEVIYLTTRCAGVLQVTGQHQIVAGDQELGPLLLELGQNLALRSGRLALNHGISMENIKERTVFWMKKYADDSIENTDNFNNIFVGDYADDFSFCYTLVNS